jgi:hypothetical protein
MVIPRKSHLACTPKNNLGSSLSWMIINPLIDRGFDTAMIRKPSRMDDHKPYTMFSPWHHGIICCPAGRGYIVATTYIYIYIHIYKYIYHYIPYGSKYCTFLESVWGMIRGLG